MKLGTIDHHLKVSVIRGIRGRYDVIIKDQFLKFKFFHRGGFQLKLKVCCM